MFGQNFPYGLVVRIPAFHAGGPGSIPGVGASFTQNDATHAIQGHICPHRDIFVPIGTYGSYQLYVIAGFVYYIKTVISDVGTMIYACCKMFNWKLQRLTLSSYSFIHPTLDLT